jgi:hypothetical protein
MNVNINTVIIEYENNPSKMRLLFHLLLLAMYMQAMYWWHGYSKHTGMLHVHYIQTF